LLILQGNSCSIALKSGEIWTVQTDLQQIYPKPDRLLSKSQRANGKKGSSTDLPFALSPLSRAVLSLLFIVFYFLELGFDDLFIRTVSFGGRFVLMSGTSLLSLGIHRFGKFVS
jgi:hypothetical protein